MTARTGLRPIDELILLAQGGNGLAFTALWDCHINQLRLYIKNRIKGIDNYVVDDICSRSFEKAFRQIQSYDPARSQFFTWLCTIARNTALDSIEQERRAHPKNQIVYLDDENKGAGLNGIADQTDDALNSLIRTESEEEREKHIEGLPQLYREVARKRFLDGMRYNEIAENMGLGLNTVKTRIRRAKQMIEEAGRQSEEADL
ncbi:MAG: RNA polymerase sigma factor [Candidatus Cryptobacteroides sp.]|jgi:RNA polymerase sigma-70 factor (ECF subfamily)|nr:sigma-70 family RNA polymerase sigma factor [Bacteroidota bacterium]NLN99550.1 sigma-70 family RNA polymerase sigma factor [Bacteroidales bacterium]